jgi:hypothetical protein
LFFTMMFNAGYINPSQCGDFKYCGTKRRCGLQVPLQFRLVS